MYDTLEGIWKKIGLGLFQCIMPELAFRLTTACAATEVVTDIS
jgi:hypothetical protein